jgi:hypothetical protein
MNTKNSSDAELNTPASGNKKTSKKKIVIIIAVLIALLSVGVIIFFVASKLKSDKINLGTPRVTNVKFPDIVPGSTVSENISAKKGGQISATNAAGVKITIDIPPNSLKDDTTVTIDPAAPNGNGGNGNNGNGNDDNNNPPGNPPDNPPDNGGNSQCANPPCDTTTPPTPPTFPPFGGFVIGPATLVFNPSATVTFSYSKGKRMIPGVEIVVSIDRNGGSHVLPTTPAVAGSFTVPIGGGGAFIPDDSSDDDGDGSGGDNGGGGGSGSGGGAGGVGDPANNAAISSGGKCTPEFLEAIKGKKNFAEGQPGHAAYDAALRDCLDVEKLKEQCANNPIVLRRRHFETRINIANSLDKEVAKELKNLLASCVAKYEIANQGAYSESGVLTSVNVNASLCGYVDDEWKGTYSYSMIVTGGGSGDCIGTESFRLPFGGGYFTVGVRCENTATILGRTISVPGGGFVFTGTFIEPLRVVLNLFGAYIVKDTNIVLKEKTCTDAAYPDAFPLPNDDEIPLVPVVRP